MYKLTCGRCVCLMFLVIIAFLSFCSGFRIDNVLAMTDLRRHRLQGRTPQADSVILNTLIRSEHRIRHSKHRHLQPERRPDPTETADEDSSIQIPSSDLITPSPTASLSSMSLISRSQRSYSRRNGPRRDRQRNRKRRRHQPKCQKQDTFRKAAMANTVMRARVQTQSASRKDNSTYNVTFNILKVYKSREPSNHDTIRLTFAYSHNPSNCESDIEKDGLVRAKLQQSQEYYLFLNSHGSYNYTVYGLPVPLKNKRKGTEAKIAKVCKDGFAQLLKEPLMNRTYEKKKHRITCTARGFPTPLIHWYKNGERLQARKSYKIVYSRRKSTLIFPELDKTDHGRYWCTTVGLNDTRTDSKETLLDEGIPCNETLSAMCINGDCFMSEILEPFCVCNNNFQGHRCDQKTSTYQQNITSCNLPQYNISHFCTN